MSDNKELITVPKSVLEAALRALEESYDLVNEDYLSDWRHGMPTRKGQLTAKLVEVTNHLDSMERLRMILNSGGQNGPA